MASTDQVRETADKCDEQNIPPAANDKTKEPVVGKTEVMTDDENSEWEDLDEVLDDFNGPKPATESAAIASSSSSSKPADTQNNAGEEEFIKQLEANMLAQLLSGGGEASGKGKAPAVPPPTNDAEEGSLPDHLKFLEGMSAKDFEKFEDELKTEGGRQRILEHIRGSKGSAGETGPAGEQAESFPDTIQRTLERMQESDEKVTVEAQTSQDKLIDASIKRLMEMVDDAAENGGKFDPEQVFNDVIKEMSNKEMLYEPMKEYNIKYGPWLEKNKATLSSEDFENYTTQAGVIKKIVEKFESKDYSDDKPECLASIWDLMQQMEACGAPPEDLIKGSMGDGVLPSLSSFLDIPEGDIPKDFDPSQVPPECNTQ